MKNIVVVERNPHIRRLLEREFHSEGCHVCGAANENELQVLMDGIGNLNLLIIDPEFIDHPDSAVWERIRRRYPKIPVIVHSLFKDTQRECPLGEICGRVEKNWNSIGELKKVAGEILNLKEAHHE